MENQFSR